MNAVRFRRLPDTGIGAHDTGYPDIIPPGRVVIGERLSLLQVLAPSGVQLLGFGDHLFNRTVQSDWVVARVEVDVPGERFDAVIGNGSFDGEDLGESQL